MAELITVARPYAEAVFRAAKETGSLAGVSDMLKLAAGVANDGAMRTAQANPRLTVAQKNDLFFSVTGDKVSGVAKNLIGGLIESQRTSLLPHISEHFDARKREHESVLKVHVVSAQALSDAERADLISTVEKRRNRKVEASFDVDANLIAGARMQIGDEVISATARDVLVKMQNAATH
jgi:F-type H+-transporting ATPase subunit delta